MASIAALEARLSRLQVCTAQEHGPEEEHRHLYAIGGYGSGRGYLDRVERYDFVSMEWETLQSLSEKRYAAAAAVVRGRVCVAGGRDGSTRLQTAVRCTTPRQTRGVPCL